MSSLFRFWRNLTKKESVVSAKYEERTKFTSSYSIREFFHGSGSGLGEKKSDPDLDRRTRIRNKVNFWGFGIQKKEDRHQRIQIQPRA